MAAVKSFQSADAAKGSRYR